MKKIIILVIAAGMSTSMLAQIYLAKTCEISFYSKTGAPALEDIAAVNSISKPLLNIITGDLQMKIVMTAFVFDKPLMQEHFNENYVESDKFPNAIFKGKINEKIDYTKDGEHKVTVTGKLTLHGVEKEVTAEGVVWIEGQTIMLSSTFKILFADYAIDIPHLLGIPPDTQIKFKAALEPFKKK